MYLLPISSLYTTLANSMLTFFSEITGQWIIDLRGLLKSLHLPVRNCVLHQCNLCSRWGVPTERRSSGLSAKGVPVHTKSWPPFYYFWWGLRGVPFAWVIYIVFIFQHKRGQEVYSCLWCPQMWRKAWKEIIASSIYCLWFDLSQRRSGGLGKIFLRVY